jgi:hypothetical protein
MIISRLTTVERDLQIPFLIGGFIYNETTQTYQVYDEVNSIWVDISIIQNIASKSVSSISMYSSNNNIPTNELILTGDLVTKQEVSRTTYAALYAVIGDVYGTPLNPSNFVLPPIVGLLPKGGTVLNYTNNGGSDSLSVGQLPIVNATGTIQVSTNDGDISVTSGSYFANGVEIGNSANVLGFIASGSQNPTVNVAGVELNSFGSGQPHEHPYQNFIYTICFESVAYGGVNPTPNLQQVSDVGFNSTNRLQFNTINYALVTDIVPALTPEEIQDAAFAILTDTPTIDLNYDDAANTVTATVIDNSITNVKLVKMPSLTVIGNEFSTTEDAQYLLLQPIIRGKYNLIAGQRTVNDIRITTTSFAYGFFTSVGNITSVPLRADIQNGFVTFTTGQITDTGEFSYEIQF